jgi:hypothetical protein
MEQAAFANASRNSLKDLFRGPTAGFFSGARQPTFADVVAKYGANPTAIIEAAARTNRALDAVGVSGIAFGALAGSDAMNGTECGGE